MDDRYTNQDFIKTRFCEHCGVDNSYCMVCEEIVKGIRRPRKFVWEDSYPDED